MKVYELLDAPEKWIKGSYANRASDDAPVDPCNPAACRWCLSGAIRRCYPGDSTAPSEKVRTKINKAIPIWNDAPNRTYADVIALAKELDI